MCTELRKHPRFKLVEGALATLSAPGELFIRIGNILDISEGGLAFSYEGNGTWPREGFEVDLIGYPESDSFVEDSNQNVRAVFVETIPVRVIYKAAMETDSWKEFKMSRCGIQFGELPQEKLDHLRVFIQRHMMETVSAIPASNLNPLG